VGPIKPHDQPEGAPAKSNRRTQHQQSPARSEEFRTAPIPREHTIIWMKPTTNRATNLPVRVVHSGAERSAGAPGSPVVLVISERFF